MKLLLYSSFLVLFQVMTGSLPLRAQSCYFDFGTTPYYEVFGNSVTQYESFDDTIFRDIPIGFPYRLGGRTWERLHISSNGSILFGDDPYSPDTLIRLLPFDADLVSDLENRSPDISYAFGGCAGAFLMKIQFHDCSFKYGTVDDFINFQVWLYESNGAFEFHYGPGHVSDPAVCFSGASGPATGISCSVGNSTPYYQVLLKGLPFSPDTSMAAFPSYLEGIPEEGQYYYFETLLPTSARKFQTSTFYPYIAYSASEPVLIYSGSAEKEISPVIYDTGGRMIRRWTTSLSAGAGIHQAPVPVQGLSEGKYFLHWTEKGKAFTLPFLNF